jgi:hypothetical protein
MPSLIPLESGSSISNVDSVAFVSSSPVPDVSQSLQSSSDNVDNIVYSIAENNSTLAPVFPSYGAAVSSTRSLTNTMSSWNVSLPSTSPFLSRLGSNLSAPSTFPTSDARHVGFPCVSFPGPPQSAVGYGNPSASLAAPLVHSTSHRLLSPFSKTHSLVNLQGGCPSIHPEHFGPSNRSRGRLMQPSIPLTTHPPRLRMVRLAVQQLKCNGQVSLTLFRRSCLITRGQVPPVQLSPHSRLITPWWWAPVSTPFPTNWLRQ